MFGKKIPLFNLFGFQVNIDLTWFLLAVLLTWSLAEGLFPFYFEGFSQSTYWWMGAAGAAGLFISIVCHEFSHSLVARHYGLPMKGITLFIFGGVAEMTDEPQNAKTELLMALAGPICSVVLGALLYLIVWARRSADGPGPVLAVIEYLAWLNLVLAVFNLLPAFPLDGGRVLRSVLWFIKKDLRWATRVAAAMGSGMGVALIVLGLITFIGGGLIGGVWYFLIGMFIRHASHTSYQQLLLRRALAGEPIAHFMHRDPVTVSPSVSIRELVDDYFYRYHYKMFPVADNGSVRGCVTSKQVRDVPADQWDNRHVQDISISCSPETSISPDTDAMKALSLMNRTGNSRLMVVQDDRLVGVITLKDMLKFLSLKVDLEGE